MQRGSESFRPDAGDLKAGFEDESPQIAFGISASLQAPEDPAVDERVWRFKVQIGRLSF
jgi:hypothetical protein